jgi:hypothetical protein
MTQFAQPAKGWILTAESQCDINGLMQGDNRALCGLRRLILPDGRQFILSIVMMAGRPVRNFVPAPEFTFIAFR